MNKSHIMSHIKLTAPIRVVKKTTAAGTRKWTATRTPEDADVVFRRNLPSEPGPSEFDGEQYLKAFTAVQTPQQALAFLNRFGSPAAEIRYWGSITFAHFKDLQRVVRTAAEVPIADWSTNVIPIGLNPQEISLVLDEDGFSFIHSTEMGVQACCAQIFFAKLSGVEFCWCAQPDCGTLFRKETGHDKIYCTYECAYVMAVRGGSRALRPAA